MGCALSVSASTLPILESATSSYRLLLLGLADYESLFRDLQVATQILDFRSPVCDRPGQIPAFAGQLPAKLVLRLERPCPHHLQALFLACRPPQVKLGAADLPTSV